MLQNEYKQEKQHELKLRMQTLNLPLPPPWIFCLLNNITENWKWKFFVAQTNFAALHSELPINMQMVLISVFGSPSSTPHQRFVKCCCSETVTFESDYFEGHNKRSYNSVQSKYPNK